MKTGFAAYRWLLARRATQLAIFALFLAGPLYGLWVVKGNLAYSLTLDTLHLADPHLLLQSLAAGHVPGKAMLIGAVTVALFYALVGGRVFCAWVCPVNVVTDTAAWLRRRLGIRSNVGITRRARYWMLAMTLVLAAATGTLAWELVNPVSMTHRAIIFGVGVAWTILLGVFVFDLFVRTRGWCGHLCPVGAFYSLLGTFSLVRVAAAKRSACDDCGDCYLVCPEPQVIKLPLKGADRGASPAVLSSACTNCGRCIDVCPRDVFRFSLRR